MISATDRRFSRLHRHSSHKPLQVIFIALLLGSAIVAAGGPLQVYSSIVFSCGRVQAAPQLYILVALAAGQIALFLAAQYSLRISAAYRITQWLALIMCAHQAALLVHAYPGFFLFLGLAVAGSAGIAFAMAKPATAGRHLSGSELFSALPYLAVLSVLLVVHWLVVSGLIAQFFLYHPSGPFAAITLVFSLTVGGIIAVAGGWSFHRRNYQELRRLDLSAFPPLLVLLLALIRAKYPDGSYDALLYKGTWPYQIAEWRTAGMAIVDQYGLGSNFQEMFNGFLLILAPDYSPSLISTLSVSALFLLLPCCITLANIPHGPSRLMFGFATAVIISLTEAATAHGTVYQEPFIVLLLALALLNAWTWPVFLSAAIATKLTAIFAVPLILFYKFIPSDQPVIAYLWRQRLAVIAAIGLIGLFLWPQIDRNLIYSGRIFGRTETLAPWTDPPGPTAILAPGHVVFGTMPRGGFVNNIALSTCNAFALDLFCPTAYQGNENSGFHVFPSSRAFLVGVLLALTTIIAIVLAGPRIAAAAIGSLAFLVGYLGFLSMASVGRFFAVPSFMLAVLVLCVPKVWLMAWGSNITRGAVVLVVAILAAIPAGDLLAGTFANWGWNCRRNLSEPAAAYKLNRPQKRSRYGPGLASEKFLQDLAAQYRKSCPPPGLSPAILLYGSGDRWLLPYLGMHVADHQMLDRFLNGNASRERNIPLAIAAIIVDDASQLTQLIRSRSSEFTSCFSDEHTQIFCSNRLAPQGRECAHSLYERMNSPDAVGLPWAALAPLSDLARSIGWESLAPSLKFAP